MPFLYFVHHRGHLAMLARPYRLECRSAPAPAASLSAFYLPCSFAEQRGVCERRISAVLALEQGRPNRKARQSQECPRLETLESLMLLPRSPILRPEPISRFHVSAW